MVSGDSSGASAITTRTTHLLPLPPSAHRLGLLVHRQVLLLGVVDILLPQEKVPERMEILEALQSELFTLEWPAFEERSRGSALWLS